MSIDFCPQLAERPVRVARPGAGAGGRVDRRRSRPRPGERGREHGSCASRVTPETTDRLRGTPPSGESGLPVGPSASAASLLENPSADDRGSGPARRYAGSPSDDSGRSRAWSWSCCSPPSPPRAAAAPTRRARAPRPRRPTRPAPAGQPSTARSRSASSPRSPAGSRSISQSLTAPVQIAVDEINAAGGVNGKPVALTVADDGGGENNDVADKALDGAAPRREKVDAIIGPDRDRAPRSTCSTGSATRAPSMCSGSNSAEELSDRRLRRLLLPDRAPRPAPGRSRSARLLVGSSGRTPPGDRGPRRRLRRRVRPRRDAGSWRSRRSGRPGRSSATTPTPRTSPRSPGRSTRRNRTRSSAISLADDGARLVNALTARGRRPRRSCRSTPPDGMQSTTFHDQVDAANPGAVQGIVGTAPAAAPTGRETPFTAAMRRAGVAPIFSAYYYDCAILTALAAVQAKSDDPREDAAARSRRACAARPTARRTLACLQLLTAGKTIHYRGASSPLRPLGRQRARAGHLRRLVVRRRTARWSPEPPTSRSRCPDPRVPGPACRKPDDRSRMPRVGERGPVATVRRRRARSGSAARRFAARHETRHHGKDPDAPQHSTRRSADSSAPRCRRAATVVPAGVAAAADYPNGGTPPTDVSDNQRRRPRTARTQRARCRSPVATSPASR